jgi:hypothetical protein
MIEILFEFNHAYVATTPGVMPPLERGLPRLRLASLSAQILTVRLMFSGGYDTRLRTPYSPRFHSLLSYSII